MKTPSELDLLMHDAEETARWMHHKLGRWTVSEEIQAHAECIYCSFGVVVDTHAPRTCPHIYGDAVNLDCPGVADEQTKGGQP